MGEDIIGNGICADTLNPMHARMRSEAGATIYAAGALVTPDGYAGDSAKWASYAGKYRMLVVIANYKKNQWLLYGGRKKCNLVSDRLLAQAGNTEDALVVAEKRNGLWRSAVHTI